jgi:glycosyltransferase involved in cell wall biosynthesis
MRARRTPQAQEAFINMAKQLIFQLGTNNWQRQGEFAPGSGILHEAHHDSMNTLPDTKCFSVYPSKKQRFEPGSAEWDHLRVFPLEHDIPICESISPVSSFRWHQMSEEDFAAYRDRLCKFCEAFIDEVEAKEGQAFSHAIAHHTFLNPIIIVDINEHRVAAGKPIIPFSIFAHGTALKMFHNELAGDNLAEFPMRFTPLVREVMAPNKAKNLFIISEAERGKLTKAYDDKIESPIILSPNGVNMKIFKPSDKTREAILSGLSTAPYEGSDKAKQDVPGAGWDKMVVFVGKFADWKRLDCMLKAAAVYEAQMASDGKKVVTIIAGSGPPDAQKLYQDMSSSLGLDGKVFFVGPQPQPVLAELYTAADIGVFPSYEEPMGMVFIECMACGTPVIGANSGGPMYFVRDSVGALVPETPALGEDTPRFCADLADTILTALKDDWKNSKGPTGKKMAEDKYSTLFQVRGMVKAWGGSGHGL